MNGQSIAIKNDRTRPSTPWQRIMLLVSLVVVIAAIIGLSLYIAPTLMAGVAGGASICGQKFNDLNGNGIWDSNEPPLPGWVIELQGAGIITSTTTNVDGFYCFEGLPDGQYMVSEVQQPDWQQTFPEDPAGGPGVHHINIQQGQSQDGVNFGNHLGRDEGGIHGRKFYDANQNHMHDPGEPGLAGWTIVLSGTAGVSTTITGAGGHYWFMNIPTGTYTITEVLQPGWVQTMPISPSHYVVSYVPSQTIDNLNFGNWAPPGEIHGMKFHDLNGDGIKDPNEPGLQNWLIGIQSDSTFSTTLTDAQGEYWFMGLPPGTYTVFEQLQSPTWNGNVMVQWVQTYPLSGTHTIALDPGEVVIDTDFGNWQGGKNDFCMIPWDNHFLNQVSMNTEIYIFDASIAPQKGYSLQLVGPTTFSITVSQPITLSPYTYAIVPIIVDYPGTFTGPSQSAQFQAIVTNLATNTTFSCYAALWSYSPQWWTSPNVNSGLGGGVPVGFTQNISFTVQNPGPGPTFAGDALQGGSVATYTISAMTRGMGMTGTVVSLNGELPGVHVTGNITYTPGQSVDIPVSIEYTEFILLGPTDIVFELDIDGVGGADMMTSYLVYLDPPRQYLPVVLKP